MRYNRVAPSGVALFTYLGAISFVSRETIRRIIFFAREVTEMAFVQELATRIVYAFRDLDGNTSTLTLYAPDTVLGEDIQTWAEGTGYAAILAMTNASITGYSIITQVKQDAPQLAVEASDVERKGTFTYPVQGGGSSTFNVPSVKNELVVDGTQVLDPDNAAVIAFHAMMEDTGLFDLVGLGNFRGDKLLPHIAAAKKTHRTSSKG